MNLRLKRWWLGVAVTLLLAILFFLLVHTSPAKKMVSRFVSVVASWTVGAELSIGELDYRLWKGNVRANRLTFSLRDEHLDIEVVVPEADLTFLPTAVSLRHPG